MNTLSSPTSSKKFSGWDFWIISLALMSALILSILSWLELCVEHCSANQDYRLFTFPFAIIGITFFTVLIILHFLSQYYKIFSIFVGWLIASALGAELMFILIQKYEIGHWCPVCISIAASVAIAALVFCIKFIKTLQISLQHNNHGEIMQKIKHGLTSLSFVLLGFLMAFIGISQPDSAEAAMNDMKERMAFGNKNSPVQVYFISDWFCPSCKKIESLIEQLYPKIKSQVTFYFIDYPIHKKSLNFSPYNLSFLVNNKPQYFQARQMLMDLTEKTEKPNDKDVEKGARKNGITFQELTFLDIKTGLEFFDTITDKYQIHATPVVIITNRNNELVKLEGRDEISEEKILSAIERLKK